MSPLDVLTAVMVVLCTAVGVALIGATIIAVFATDHSTWISLEEIDNARDDDE